MHCHRSSRLRSYRAMPQQRGAALGILAAAAVIVPVIVLRSHHSATRRAAEQAEDALRDLRMGEANSGEKPLT